MPYAVSAANLAAPSSLSAELLLFEPAVPALTQERNKRFVLLHRCVVRRVSPSATTERLYPTPRCPLPQAKLLDAHSRAAPYLNCGSTTSAHPLSPIRPPRPRTALPGACCAALL